MVRTCPSDACFQAQFDRAYARKVDDLQCSGMLLFEQVVAQMPIGEWLRPVLNNTVPAGVAAAVKMLCEQGLDTFITGVFSKDNFENTYPQLEKEAMEYFVSAELEDKATAAKEAAEAAKDAAESAQGALSAAEMMVAEMMVEISDSMAVPTDPQALRKAKEDVDNAKKAADETKRAAAAAEAAYAAAEEAAKKTFFCPDAGDLPNDAARVNCQNLGVLALNVLLYVRLTVTDAEAKENIKNILGYALSEVPDSSKIVAAVLEAAPFLETYWTAVNKTMLMVIDGACTRSKSTVRAYFEEVAAYLVSVVCTESETQGGGSSGDAGGGVWAGLKWGTAVSIGIVLCVAASAVDASRISVLLTGLALAIPFFLLQISSKGVSALTLFSGLFLGGLPPSRAAYVVSSCIAMAPPAAWAAYALSNRHTLAWLYLPGVASSVVLAVVVTLLIIGVVLYCTTSIEMRANEDRGADAKECSYFACKSLPWSAVTAGEYGFCGRVAGFDADVEIDVPGHNGVLFLNRLVVAGEDYLKFKDCESPCGDGETGTPYAPVKVVLSAAQNGMYSFTRSECVACIMDKAPVKVRSIKVSLTSPTSIRMFLSVGLAIEIELKHPPGPCKN